MDVSEVREICKDRIMWKSVVSSFLLENALQGLKEQVLLIVLDDVLTLVTAAVISPQLALRLKSKPLNLKLKKNVEQLTVQTIPKTSRYDIYCRF
ncbi:hypothetical protein EVAR_5027_1 [Eumeta japonica]|uniref:Uncharacterized protein n=1 Tax=Eumeta variegata TaxID=151549 RepID=A0A4C1SXC9_EUMVA|nr:hypothetical protein EVAR_5027_1 [Eumeta japonica]